MRGFGLPVGWSNVCQDVWVTQQGWVSFQGCVHGTPLSAPRSIPQGDLLGPILCLLWTTCGLNSVSRGVPADAVPARTVLYMDDRSVVSSSAESLLHHTDAWFQWSGQVSLIENESKVSLAVQSPPGRSVPNRLASFVQSPVRVLCAYTAVSRRRMCSDEETRLAKASQTIYVGFYSTSLSDLSSVRCHVCHASSVLRLGLPSPHCRCHVQSLVLRASG